MPLCITVDRFLQEGKEAAEKYKIDNSIDKQNGSHKLACDRLKNAAIDRIWIYHLEFDCLGLETLSSTLQQHWTKQPAPNNWTTFFKQQPKFLKYVTKTVKSTKQFQKKLSGKVGQLNEKVSSLTIAEDSFKRAVTSSMSAPMTILHAMLSYKETVMKNGNTNKPEPISVVVAGANTWCELNSEEANFLRYGFLEQYLPKGRTLHLDFIGPEVPDELICLKKRLSEKITISCIKEAYDLSGSSNFKSKPDMIVIMNPGLHSDYHESWMSSLKPVMEARVPMVICTWNFYEELGPTVMHLEEGAKQIGVELELRIKENPFRSLVYRQHDKRPNNLRCSNWTFIQFGYK